MNLNEFHQIFSGGWLWRVTPEGVEVQDWGLIPVPAANLARDRELLERYHDDFAVVSRTEEVPLELLAACAFTEGAPVHPETSVREEPGYISDESTA